MNTYYKVFYINSKLIIEEIYKDTKPDGWYSAPLIAIDTFKVNMKEKIDELYTMVNKDTPIEWAYIASAPPASYEHINTSSHANHKKGSIPHIC